MARATGVAILAAVLTWAGPAGAQADWKEANRASAAALKAGAVSAGADFALQAFRGYEQSPTYSARNHAQLLLNLLGARVEAAGRKAALDEFDVEVERFRQKAGARDPHLVDLWTDAAEKSGDSDREEAYLARAAALTESLWGPADARSIVAQRRWADAGSRLFDSRKGRPWARQKLLAAREHAGRLTGGEPLLWMIDLSLARLHVEERAPKKAIELIRSVIAQVETRNDPELRELLVYGYALVGYACGQAKDDACAQDTEARLNAIVGGQAQGPNVVLRVSPQYPRRAAERRIEGSITMELTIGVDGKLRDAQVLFANPPGYFEEASLEALKSWKFLPRVIDGVAYETKGVQVFNYVLDRR